MKKYNPITNPYAKRTILFLIAAIFTLTAQGPAVTSALTAEQKKLLNQNIYYYDPYNCADVEENAGGEARGTGSPNGLALPNLSTESMTEAVKQWIKEKRPSSPFIKLADEIVASSQKAGISPFIVPVLGFRESGLGTNHAGLDLPGPGWYNSFGRTAIIEEGHPGKKGPGNPRTWWVWNSLKASVDYNDPYNEKYREFGGDMSSYISIRYKQYIDTNDVKGVVEFYAPPGDNTEPGNTTADFLKLMQDSLNEMGQKAVSLGGGPTADGSPAPTPAGTKAYLLGDSISLGAKPLIESGFQAKNVQVTVNASASRSILRKGVSDGNKTSGMEVLDIPAQQELIKNSSNIIIALGTNVDGSGSVVSYETNMKRLIEKARGINASANVSVVNIFSPAVAKKDAYNAMLARLSKSLKFKLIDVASKAIVTPDNIHPNPAGQQIFADTIVSAVTNLSGCDVAGGAVEEGGECACPESGASGSEASADGNNNVEIAFNFLVNEGKFSPELAAAFVGNFRQEAGSQMTTIAENPSSGATGIAQWLGGRKTNLFAFAAEKGKPATDLMTQLEFVLHELNGKEKAAYDDIKAVRGSGKEYIAAVTHAIRVKYERPGEAEANDRKRIKYAFEVYDDLKNSVSAVSPDGVAAESPGGCGGLSGGNGFVSADGYAFPVEPQRQSQNSGIAGLTSF